MTLVTIKLHTLQHRGAACHALRFDFDRALINLCKDLGARWSNSNKCWYIEKRKVEVQQIFNHFKGKAWVDASALYNGQPPKKSHEGPPAPAPPKAATRQYPLTKPLPAVYLEKLTRKRYSPNTIKSYAALFRDFINYYPKLDPAEITEDQIHHYLDYLIKEREISCSTQNQVINAIKFYYEKVLGQEKKEYWIDRPKKEKKLPEIVSKEEIELMLKATANLKHYSIIAALYSAGLRRNELLNLRLSDIHFDRQQIWVRGGKGKKDRITLLSTNLIPIFKRYLQEYKPNYWFVEGPNRKQYSTASIAAVVKAAAQAAGLQKNVTPHMLRHSFATHLMDHGVDTRVIQKLLGHSSIKTTSIYTHVSQKDLQKIISPFDHILKPN